MSEALAHPLHQAALNGDIDTLNRLLADGADVDCRDETGRTPLFCAARSGEGIAARHLLKRGAQVDCETSEGTTAIVTAARGGHAEMVRLLLANGADPNQIVHPQPVVVTPEMLETQRKMLEMTRDRLGLTLDQDKFEERMREREAPRKSNTLSAAIMSRDAETVFAVLEGGADVNNESGSTRMSPLRTAVAFSEPDVIRALIERGARLDDDRDEGGVSILSAAVMKQRVDNVRLLLELGADPNSGERMPPLAFAVQFENLEMVKLLLEFGASLEPNENGFNTVVVMARSKPEIMRLFARHQENDWHAQVESGDLAGVRSRLDAGADIEVRSTDKRQTALMLASASGHGGLIKLLLERGADVDAGDKFQITALMYGIREGHAEVVRALLAHGANVDATNRWGQSALTSALSDEKREIRDLLIAAGATIGIVEAALLGENATVMTFLVEGVPVDQPNPAGTTAFMAAASRGDIGLATALHERGADLSSQDTLGRTAFHHAVQQACGTGDTTLLALLLDWGADINGASKQESGCLRTPVMLGSETVLRFLLDHGADLTGQHNAIGQPLLHTAIFLGRGKLTTIEILLEYGADVQAADKMGSTPLMEVVGLSKRAIGDDADGPEYVRAVAKRLIAAGANVNPDTRHGTVLDRAIGTGDIELVRLLLDAGADPKRIGGLHVIALNTERRSPEMTALLRERGAEIPEPIAPPAGMPEGFAEAMAAGKMPPDFVSKMLDLLNARRKAKGS